MNSRVLGSLQDATLREWADGLAFTLSQGRVVHVLPTRLGKWAKDQCEGASDHSRSLVVGGLVVALEMELNQ